MFESAIVILLLLWQQDAVKSVRIVELRVPTDKPEGGTALLGCQYDLEGDTLYSLKWYKGTREFYRFVPKNEPPVYYFDTPGVYVDIGHSSNTVVALKNLTQESEGYYRCEVSGEGPSFTTVSRHKKINIYLIPKTGPRLTGLQDKYRVDDYVVGNCSLPPSRPLANLEWIVNDKPASPEKVLDPWHVKSAEHADAPEVILQLSFQATYADFINGAIKLKCRATIPPLYQRETESIHYLSFPDAMTTNQPETTEASLTTDYAASMETSLVALIVPIIFLILV